ncbi:MAG TPA: DNA mismatch repair endonuclease MutL [Aquificales bacterium]|uniref:DNA mismatch repair protein MutL n=1 Tax=Aquifex aeolicus TaxID=63363 RepID=A0A9D1CFY7_AQUAO|nr:DNA mismatch repair endonuclease MutL [Aquificales bacterium]HIP86566.1 DNA mismatch repair endonuclease MutL [Aquifex sp.]HIP97943.1 DNA mismatch repair endonuclease MutL [Aquifex aeolicus]
MGEVKVLPPEVRKLIAAGEVIERPANVVKELVENSLDAQAKSVYVETLQGGKRLIEVRDNGKGILKEDLPKVILEGATSKIEKAEDLFSVKTLGFRGEALSSIAEVSRITVTSRHFSQDRGYQLLARGGKAEYLREVAHPVGTTVVVEELFFNLPVRLKFLKSAKTERKHITETVVTYALANPQVAFTLIQEGKRVLELKPSSVEERILEIFKLEYPPFRVQAQNELGKAEIFYYTNFRSNKFFIFLNGRPIFNRELQTYLKNKLGYKTLAVLFLEIPPYLVDVNVHPRKEEVRFLQQRKVLNLLGKLFGEEKTPLPPLEMLKNSTETEYLQPPQFEILGQVEETLIVAYRKGFIYFFDQHLLDEVVNFALTGDETKACKSSIKAGDKLSKKQMEELLSRWEALGLPQICPHGRPIFFKISVGEILKKLGR